VLQRAATGISLVAHANHYRTPEDTHYTAQWFGRRTMEPKSHANQPPCSGFQATNSYRQGKMKTKALLQTYWWRMTTLAAIALATATNNTGAQAGPDPASAPPNQVAPPVKPELIVTNRPVPVLFLIGDSTVHNADEGLKGWGDVVGKFFDTNKIRIENHARGGRSSRTFQTQGWWDHVLAAARPGDFVMIQFGHNDASPLDDTNRARGTLPGLSDESKEIYNPITKKHERVRTYGWYMRKYITDARAKGVTPIVCSPVPRLPKQTVQPDTMQTNSYAVWAQQVALQENAFFIDLHALILRHYVGLTPEEVKSKYFTTHDNTHTSPIGAELNAACVVEGLRQLKDCKLRDFLLP